jgi:hypothetical protein
LFRICIAYADWEGVLSPCVVDIQKIISDNHK